MPASRAAWAASYAGTAVVGAALAGALVVYAFFTSPASKPLLGATLDD